MTPTRRKNGGDGAGDNLARTGSTRRKGIWGGNKTGTGTGTETAKGTEKSTENETANELRVTETEKEVETIPEGATNLTATATATVIDETATERGPA
jgi:hypothetical protein